MGRTLVPGSWLAIMTIHPLLVACLAIGAAIGVCTMPMPSYIRNSLAVMLGWFGVSYIIVYALGFDLATTSFLIRFNLIILFVIVIACAFAWHAGSRRRWNHK